jgi:hypothetical protein
MVDERVLRRWAAGLYAQIGPGEARKCRPLPGNELVLSHLEESGWTLTLRREERPIEADDLAAVAAAFAAPEGCEPTLRRATETNAVSGRAAPVFYARWAWREVT